MLPISETWVLETRFVTVATVFKCNWGAMFRLLKLLRTLLADGGPLWIRISLFFKDDKRICLREVEPVVGEAIALCGVPVLRWVTLARSTQATASVGDVPVTAHLFPINIEHTHACEIYIIRTHCCWSS